MTDYLWLRNLLAKHGHLVYDAKTEAYEINRWRIDPNNSDWQPLLAEIADAETKGLLTWKQTTKTRKRLAAVRTG